MTAVLDTTESRTSSAAGPSPAPRRRRRCARRSLAPYLFLAPGFALFLLVIVYPMVRAFQMSFYDWNVVAGAASKFTGFANYRLSAKSVDAANTNYVLGVRVTGQSGDPYTFGTMPLSYGTEYRVIVQASATGTNMIAYVNPTSSSQAGQTQYANNPVGTGTAPLTVGSFVISEFGTTTLASDGGSIGKVVVADSFATVYNDLLGALPPVASFSGSPTK